MNRILKGMEEKGFFLKDAIQADGKVHRFKKDKDDKRKSAWYIGFQNFFPKSSEVFYVFEVGDWRNNEQFQISTLEGKAIGKEEKKLIKDNQAKARKQKDYEREKNAKDCAKKSKEMWPKLSEEGSSSYLKRKLIPELYGVRVGTANLNGVPKQNVLFVPMYGKGDKLKGFQRIYPDGSKKVSYGIDPKGAYFVFGENPANGEEVYVCEGFATAASVYQATGKPTVCAFFANNLAAVCLIFNENNEVVLCADDDQFTPPEKGGNAGRKASEKCPASAIVFPEFKNLDDKPTDFNDLHVREGIEVLRKQISGIERGDYVSCLGYNGKNYFFRSSQNLQIVCIPRESFTKNTLRDLIEESYWEKNYPGENGPDWDQAYNDLMRKGRRRGIFDDTKVRGVGVWRDEHRFVINLGDSLYFDDKKQPLDGLKDSHYVYEQGRKMSPPTLQPLWASEGALLTRTLKSLLWKSPDAYKLLAGWLVIAPVCGALDWRPHLWITAPKGSGKSYIMENIINPLIREWRNFFIGQSTEAGVRQTQKSDARPIQFDEFESEDEKGAMRIQSILELLRQASSESEGFVVKGTPTGNALHYRPRFSCIVSSIRVSLVQDADISRFTILELDEPHKGSPEQFENLKEYIREMPDDYANRLFSRTFSKMDVLKENIKSFWTALRKVYTPRIAQQYSALLAGYYLLEHDHAAKEVEAEAIVNKLNLEETQDTTSNAEHDDCLEHILKTVIRFEFENGTRGSETVSNLIFEGWQEQSPRSQIVLGRHGMTVDHKKAKLYISNKHPELKKLFKGTIWASGNWAKSLGRVPNAVPRSFTRIDRKLIRATQLDLTQVLDVNEDGENVGSTDEEVPF